MVIDSKKREEHFGSSANAKLMTGASSLGHINLTGFISIARIVRMSTIKERSSIITRSEALH